MIKTTKTIITYGTLSLITVFGQVGSRPPDPFDKPEVPWKATYRDDRVTVLVDTTHLQRSLRLISVALEALSTQQALVTLPVSDSEHSLERGRVYEKVIAYKGLDAKTLAHWRLKFTVVADGMYFHTAPVFVEECCKSVGAPGQRLKLPNTDDPLKAFSIPYYTIGLLYRSIDANQPVGSGFVFEDSRFVVSANHLVEGAKTVPEMSFMPIKGVAEGPAYTIRLHPYLRLPACDVIVFSVEGKVPWTRPLTRGDFNRFQATGTAPYGGYDPVTSSPLELAFSITAGRVLGLLDSGSVRYLQMEGYALPGFSGGPVFAGGESVGAMIVRGTPADELRRSQFEAVSLDCVPKLTEAK